METDFTDAQKDIFISNAERDNKALELLLKRRALVRESRYGAVLMFFVNVAMYLSLGTLATLGAWGISFFLKMFLTTIGAI